MRVPLATATLGSVNRSQRFRQAALVLAAHGSHLNPNSAAPCYALADAIRRRRLFGEVQECFWKQEPPFRHVCQMLEASEIFVVPFFISDGYFTEKVLPRELGVTGRKSHIDAKLVHYCPPVGTHDAMTQVILHRAHAIVHRGVKHPPAPRATALCIAGHGTSQNENSATSIHRQVELISRLDRYAEVQAIFMDQEPAIEKCYQFTRSPNLVIVPFFISDGLHTQEDIPDRLGLKRHPSGAYAVPSRVGRRRVWYSGAIGTDPRMVDVVLERASRAAAN